ncbi:MAG: glycosyltransferase [Alphaproteobacteria bacterium]|nr:glycosyltransferase [Alphaproteobacteria bacterium]
MLLTILSALSLAIWIYLVSLHGRFWRADQRLDRDIPAPAVWPAVIAVVPARNEADVIARSMGSLLDQDYPGPFQVVLVDDSSEDGTGDAARALARTHPRGERLSVVSGAPLPPGWVGKMWAVHNGIARADQADPAAPYLWLTDADIAHGPGVLRALVAKAEAGRLHLVSLMALLHCRRPWERLLIPAFVYFFQKLYPFPRVNDPADRLAGAAGGCMLVRRDALRAIGGIAAIRAEVIDDCALGRALKKNGPIWLGLAEDTHSIRPYEGLKDIWRMVARSAYDQLGYSPLALAGTVIGMALVYLVPPLVALSTPWHGNVAAGAMAGLAWLLMGWSSRPTLALYGKPAPAALLPVAGLLYNLMTLDSALAYYRGRGAFWKGRAQAPVRRA